MTETIVMDEWSWSRLVRALGGDEERALELLPRMPGLGEFEDEAHRRAPRRTPVVVLPPPPPRTLCPEGHPLTIRNGSHRNGDQRWLCSPCTSERRRRTYSPDARRLRRKAG